MGSLQVAVHGDFAWITLKALLQSQANESHVFIHQGDLLLGSFYLQLWKEAKIFTFLIFRARTSKQLEKQGLEECVWMSQKS